MAERVPQSATLRVPLQAYLASDHVSQATGKTIAITISKNGAAYGNPSAGATNATEIGNGSYYVDLSTTDTGTTGPLFVRGTEGTIDNVVAIYNVVNPHNAGYDGVPAVTAAAAGGLPTVGSGAGQIALTTGAVTVGTNNDKTGYSLTQAFPTNFASLAITVGGAVTVGTNNDKTGYSLTQAFPTNFASLVITVGGAVTAGTVSDKTGYALVSTGLDLIPITDPGGIAGQTTFPKIMVAMYRRWFKKTTLTSTQLKHYADDGVTVNTTQVVSDDGTTQTAGAGT